MYSFFNLVDRTTEQIPQKNVKFIINFFIVIASEVLLRDKK